MEPRSMQSLRHVEFGLSYGLASMGNLHRESAPSHRSVRAFFRVGRIWTALLRHAEPDVRPHDAGPDAAEAIRYQRDREDVLALVVLHRDLVRGVWFQSVRLKQQAVADFKFPLRRAVRVRQFNAVPG